MKIAILGAGNAGCAHAFKFTEIGHEVNLIKTSHAMHDENFEEMIRNGGIWALDSTNGNKKSFQKINLLTRDIKQGLEDVEVIFILTQSLQHEAISELIKFTLPKSLKMVLVIPGNLGSIFFRNICDDEIIVGEGESTPFDARIIEPGIVNILFKNVRNKLAFTPNTTSIKGLSIANEILETYVDIRSNIIESALHNPNLIVHTIGVIMSANRIELTKGEFWMYREAFTDSIWNLINELDIEKNTVIEKYLGIGSSYLDECKYRNEFDLNIDSLAVFQSYAKSGGPKGPKTIHSRYLYEDIPNGLCLLNTLAIKAGIETPISNSLVQIANCLTGVNFIEKSKILHKNSIIDKSYSEIISFL